MRFLFPAAIAAVLAAAPAFAVTTITFDDIGAPPLGNADVVGSFMAGGANVDVRAFKSVYGGDPNVAPTEDLSFGPFVAILLDTALQQPFDTDL